MKTSKATKTTRARTKMIQMIMVSIMTIIMIIPTINNIDNIKSNGEKSNTHGKNNMFNTHTHACTKMTVVMYFNTYTIITLLPLFHITYYY